MRCPQTHCAQSLDARVHTLRTGARRAAANDSADGDGIRGDSYTFRATTGEPLRNVRLTEDEPALEG